jgi:uncharacterized ferritin-like protein (DUF455 family)
MVVDGKTIDLGELEIDLTAIIDKVGFDGGDVDVISTDITRHELHGVISQALLIHDLSIDALLRILIHQSSEMDVVCCLDLILNESGKNIIAGKQWYPVRETNNVGK